MIRPNEKSQQYKCNSCGKEQSFIGYCQKCINEINTYNEYLKNNPIQWPKTYDPIEERMKNY